MQKEEYKCKRKDGISLIVLSITILVMAILAATAIIALEDTGIIGRSKSTASKQNYNEEYTRLQVIKNGILTDNLGTITVDEYITELTNRGVIESGVTTNSDGSKTVTTKTGFAVNIMQSGASDLAVSLGEADAAITLSSASVSGDITSGTVTKAITVTTKNVSGDITWSSSNSNVASVTGTNTNATITMKNVGTATITATYGNAKATCTVTVTGTVTTPTISLDKTTISKTITSGTTTTETLTATTANISGTLTWSSSNTSVATVSGSGNTATVTLKAGGTAVITASYGTTSASCTITVTETSAYGTVTITSATVDPTAAEGDSAVKVSTSSTLNLSATVNKSNANEELIYTYKFYSLNSSTGAQTYESESDVTVTSTDASITATKSCDGMYGYYYLVVLEIHNTAGELVASKNIENYTLSASGYAYTTRITCMPAGTLVTVEVEEEDESGKKRKRRKKKRIEDLTYDDDLVVWDFDNGCFTTAKPIWLKRKEYADEYNELTFSDGSVLKTIREHRIFNKELGKFTYPMGEETPIGTTTFNENGEEVTLVNRRVVDEKVEYYNVITNYHINAFAEGILTSCRLSNLYEIKDMKYVKDDREIVSVKEFKDIPEEYYHGLRLGEQRRDVNNEGDFKDLNSWTEYVNRLLILKKDK